jgi:hypothetical protein
MHDPCLVKNPRGRQKVLERNLLKMGKNGKNPLQIKQTTTKKVYISKEGE